MLKQGRHYRRRLEALGGVLGMQPGDQVAEPLRHLGDDLADRPGRVLGHPLQDRQRAAGAERRPAAGHRVQDAAEAEQVGAVVERPAVSLLRRHVQRRAGDRPRPRQAGVVGRPGQPEVGDLDGRSGASLQQDVARLDVAVDQTYVVGGGQPAGDLSADAEDLGHFERAGLLVPLLQGRARDVLHDQVGQRLLLDGIDPDDVAVPDAGGGAGLAQESLPRRRGGRQPRVEHLEGHDAVQRLVEGPHHDAEAAPAEDLQHLVMAQSAQRPRPRGRLEEFEPQRLLVLRPFLGLRR